jgi:circadian clock protein KaiB
MKHMPLAVYPDKPGRRPRAAREVKNRLRLFVAGATDRSRQAILCVRRLCETRLNKCELEVIDIYQQPGLARDHQIVATPTLIINLPKPLRRFIGNLLNTAGLIIAPESPAPRKTASLKLASSTGL